MPLKCSLSLCMYESTLSALDQIPEDVKMVLLVALESAILCRLLISKLCEGNS